MNLSRRFKRIILILFVLVGLLWAFALYEDWDWPRTEVGGIISGMVFILSVFLIGILITFFMLRWVTKQWQKRTVR